VSPFVYVGALALVLLVAYAAWSFGRARTGARADAGALGVRVSP
jgi:hypothetical protein